MSKFPQLPGFLLKSDMFMRVRVRVISNEVFAGGLILPLGYCSARVVCYGLCQAGDDQEVPQSAPCGESGMLEQKQALSALLQFSSASVEYLEISEGIAREKSQSSPGFLEDMHHPPLLSVIARLSIPPTVDAPAAFVWLLLVIGSDHDSDSVVCRRGDTIRQ